MLKLVLDLVVKHLPAPPVPPFDSGSVEASHHAYRLAAALGA